MINDIQVLGPGLPRSAPSLGGYDGVSEGWREWEHRAQLPRPGVIAGYWTGEPGWVEFISWPYNELCVILTGRVALEDSAGGRREFAAGESFLVPEGFRGRWVTVEPTTKIFVGVESVR